MANGGFGWGPTLTDIVEGVWNRSVRGLTETIKHPLAVGSDNVRASANTERSVVGTTYTKVKEIRIYISGTMNVRCELRSSVDTATAKAKLLINGSQYGDICETTSTTYVQKGWSCYAELGDKLQIEICCSVADRTAYIRNVAVSYDPTGYETQDPYVLID